MTAPQLLRLAQRALHAVPTGPTQSSQPSGPVACAARARAATLLSLHRAVPQRPAPSPEGLGQLPPDAHDAAETAADWSTREYGLERRAVPPANGP